MGGLPHEASDEFPGQLLGPEPPVQQFPLGHPGSVWQRPEVDSLGRMRLDSSEWGHTLRNWMEPRERGHPPVSLEGL